MKTLKVLTSSINYTTEHIDGTKCSTIREILRDAKANECIVVHEVHINKPDTLKAVMDQFVAVNSKWLIIWLAGNTIKKDEKAMAVGIVYASRLNFLSLREYYPEQYSEYFIVPNQLGRKIYAALQAKHTAIMFHELLNDSRSTTIAVQVLRTWPADETNTSKMIKALQKSIEPRKTSEKITAFGE